jgi:RimJ/RimL family protein N-acetyltransferase
MIAIETDRLVIRNFKGDDSEALRKMIVQYEASEYAAYDEQWPTSAEKIKGVTEWFASGDNFLAVCLKDTSQFIGFVALNPEEGNEYNLGYVFDSDYHGHGYATEACQAILDRAFDQLQALKVISGTASVNRNSCRLLERLGFQKTGERITSFKTGEDGKPIEFLGYLYTISNEAWQSRQRERSNQRAAEGG